MTSQPCHNLRTRQVVHGACDVITECFLTQVISLNCGAPQIDTPAGLSALLSSEPSHSETLDSRTFRLQEFFCQLFLGPLMKQGFWQVFNWLPEKLFWINFCKFRKFLVQKIFGRKRIFINQILWQIFFLQNEFQTFFSFFLHRQRHFWHFGFISNLSLDGKSWIWFFWFVGFFHQKKKKTSFLKISLLCEDSSFWRFNLAGRSRATKPRGWWRKARKWLSVFADSVLRFETMPAAPETPKLLSKYYQGP